MNFDDFYLGLDNFFRSILPYLVGFMGFALPIAFGLGNILKYIIEPISANFIDDMMWIYIIIAICVFLVGGYYNFKYPYRKNKKD